MSHQFRQSKKLVSLALLTALAAALIGCPPSAPALRLFNVLATNTVIGQVMQNDAGEQLVLLADKTAGGEVADITGGACFTPGGAAFTFWVGDDGLPLYAVAEGYVFHFYGYTSDSMDIIVTESDGTSYAINGVALSAGQVAECLQFAAGSSTTGDAWRYMAACTGIVVCGVTAFADEYDVAELALVAGLGCAAGGLDLIDAILDATGGAGFGAGSGGTSFSGVSTSSCTDALNCPLGTGGLDAGEMDDHVDQARADLDAIIGGSGSGGLRFVLTWGETPYDLDSHLWTPMIDGVSHHIYYSNREAYSVLASPYADLDVDDITSYGPETITIAQLFPGTYTYSVYNYTGSPDMTTSGAKVAVYDSLGLVGQYSIPTSGSGRWWHLFEIDGGTGSLTVINTIDDISDKSYAPTVDAK